MFHGANQTLHAKSLSRQRKAADLGSRVLGLVGVARPALGSGGRDRIERAQDLLALR